MYPSSLISLFTDPVHPELNPLPEVPQTPEVNSSPLFLVEPDPDWLSQICGGAAADSGSFAKEAMGLPMGIAWRYSAVAERSML